MAQEVLLLGHSFVRHLKSFMRRSQVFNMTLDPASISMHVYGGLDRFDKINLIHEARSRVVQILGDLPAIDVAILILGSNDLSSDVERNPKKIANSLVELAQVLLDNGVKRVAMVQCLPRYGWAAFKRFCTLDAEEEVWTLDDLEQMFEDRVRQFNKQLKERAEATPGMDFICLKGLRREVREKFADGLHLDSEGQRSLMRTLRRETIYNCRKALGGREGFGRRRRRRSNRTRRSRKGRVFARRR